jgi:glycogen debranching enzyme
MMNDLPKMKDYEWLEANGLGGFVSGTVSSIRTRRYHVLLLAATKPPSGRVVLVNGFDAWVETEGGTFSLSSQLYNPDVMHPDGARRIEQFRADPWPQWIYSLEDGTKIQFELFACNGASVTVLGWHLAGSDGAKRDARRRFLMPIMEHLNIGGLGHVSEIADADPPHTPRGCPFQAWSVGEVLAWTASFLRSLKGKKSAHPLARERHLRM